MRTAVEYLALSERYRIVKLSTHDVATQDQLEIFERSYFVGREKSLKALSGSRFSGRDGI